MLIIKICVNLIKLIHLQNLFAENEDASQF